MANPKSLTFGIGDLHLMGKILDIVGEDTLRCQHEMGFTAREMARAEALWETLEAHLDQHVGPEWDEEEVL